MPRRHLTAVAVEKLRPTAQRREIPVGGAQGLYLVIQPTGAKSWHLRYRRHSDDKSIKLKLGDVATSTGKKEEEPVIGAQLTLAAAKKLAADLSHKIAQGKDPAAEQRQENQDKAEAADTFAAAVRDYLHWAEVEDKQRCWTETAATLGLRNGRDPVPGSLFERWGGKPLTDIDADLVFGAVRDARSKGIPGLGKRVQRPSEARARAVHSSLSRLFAWAKDNRKVKVSPMAELARPKTPTARERILDDDEIRKFWQATGELKEPFGSALKLLLITGQRRDEVAGMKLAELSDDLATWSLPADRVKNKKAHTVPLPPMARDIISGVQRVGDEFVFTTTGSTPISGWSKTKNRLDAAMGISDWVIHDLRRTAVSGMARAGARLEVIEKAINHVSGSFGGVAGVYQRHEYKDEVRAALEAWANLLRRIIDGTEGNVVELRRP